MNPLVDRRVPAATADKWFGHLATVGRWLGENAQSAYRKQNFASDYERVKFVKDVMENLRTKTLPDNGIADFGDAQFFCDYTAGIYCPSGYYCESGYCMPNGTGGTSHPDTGAILDAKLFAHLQTIGLWVGRNSQVTYQKLPVGVDRVAFVKKVMNDLKTNMPNVVQDPGSGARFFCDAQKICSAGYVCDGGICVPA